MLYLVLLLTVILSLAAQSFVKSNYQKYSRIRTLSGMTGKQVAEKILADNNLHDVKVIQSRAGILSDHYDPTKNIVALSPGVYASDSIASVAVAAHEVGHAIQHATGYHGIKVRNILLKPTIVASQFSQIALFIGLISGSILFELGIIMLGVILLFQAVTLPIEFDASNRALKIIQADHIVTSSEYNGAKSMLTAAALTYVAAVLGAAANLLYYMSLRGNRK